MSSSRPDYYHTENLECFQVIEELGANFNIGNAIKYLWRYKHKNGAEDLRKAMVYIEREIASLESRCCHESE